MTWVNLLSVWLSLAAVIITTVNVRRRGQMLLLGYRRESGLAAMLQVGDEQEWEAASVAFADECWNQQRHLASKRFLLWPRVPELGRPWPDFEPAPMVTINDP